MEIDQETASPRASLSFPLGLALLLALLLGMSAFFCCCLHWDKIRSLLGIQLSGEFSQPDGDHNHITASPHKTLPPLMTMKQNQVQSLPVLMPGDEVPKFIAMACPCQPPVMDKLTIKVHDPCM
ncbi:hydroxyproline-rich glycoprotein family protein [Quillaja saponaria]|uniref:Hydroxyproline-rich glycoprotein family protein n=1 Tax=Quillaja saponaria TaxID=32244 RepID=A0AAD7PL71_QUISA|nr:hydroxyproline-rich glycoprotein family protein [Quillaja saponaria]